MNTITILSLIALIIVCLTVIHERRLRQAARSAIWRLVQSHRRDKALKDRAQPGKG